MQYAAFDAHKHYTWARVERPDGTLVREKKITHERGAFQQFLADCEPGSPVAVEPVGNWYWIVDEVARELRDARELPRTRMVLVAQRTRFKNRIHATLNKYGMQFPEISDLFGTRGRQALQTRVSELPTHTGFVICRLLEQIAALDREIEILEQRMGTLFEIDDAIRLVLTRPGVGFILSVVIRSEIGDVSRFHRGEQLAAYAGTVPRVHESGGRRHYGPVRSDVNQYLKWAFVEAANGVCRNRRKHPQRHTSRVYERIVKRRGHQTAVVAVARHLAEAAYWMLSKGKVYREPGSSRGA